MKMALLIGVGILSGFINVAAGGGSAITLPVLIFLGLPTAAANGTNRIGVLMQNISGVYSFQREKYSDFKLSMKLALCSVPSAIIGAMFAISLNDKTFKIILGVIMIGIIATLFIPVKKNNNNGEDNKKYLQAYILMFLVGFYGGFIQAAIGFLIMASLKFTLKLNLTLINMHKLFIVLINTIPALIVFAISGNVYWVYGIILGIGNAAGAWWSAKLQVKKGDKFVKAVTALIMVFMILKLFGVV